MKTITDELFEENIEEYRMMYEDYKEYVDNTKKSAIESLKFAVISWAILFFIAALIKWLRWKILTGLGLIAACIALFGPIAVGFYYKGGKPVFEMFKYYVITIMSTVKKVTTIFHIIPILGSIAELIFLLMVLQYVFAGVVAIWGMTPPLAYYFGYIYYKKKVKALKIGFDRYNRNNANVSGTE